MPYTAMPHRTSDRCVSGTVNAAAELARCTSGTATSRAAASKMEICSAVNGSSGASAIAKWVHSPSSCKPGQRTDLGE